MNEDLPSVLTILIADDSNTDRLLLDTIIKNQGHKTLLAEDGRQAINLFQAKSPDIILLDALMPNVDGFEAARFIKANSGDDFVPIIFLTSLNETSSLVNCLEAGGDDFLTKPYNSIILGAKINAFWRMLNMHITLQRQRDLIAENNQRLVQEQEVAKLTFDKIAHEGCLHAPNIKHLLSPLAIFNGDVLLAALRPNGNLCVLLGDFTGHGLAAAMGAIPLSQAFYSMVAKGFCIKDIAIELNGKLKEILPLGIFCCACIVDIDFSRKIIEIWNGGLPDNFIFRAATKQLEFFKSTHLPLGILTREKFQSDTASLFLNDDDRFYIWSDGVFEAENELQERFGDERLKKIFSGTVNSGSLFGNIKEAIERFMGGNQLSDDLSMAEITMVSKDVFDSYQLKPVITYSTVKADWTFSLKLTPESIKLSDPLPLIQQLLLDSPGIRGFSGDLFIVISELFNNALEHGLLKLSSELKTSPEGFSTYYKEREQRLKHLVSGSITINLEYSGSNKKGTLFIQVIDSGDGFDFKKINTLQSSHKSYSGRGIYLVKTLCEDVTFVGKGNQVKAIFTWGQGR